MNILRSKLPDVRIPDTCVTDFVLRHAARLGDKPAFIEGASGRVVSYRALVEQVRALAGGLRARGVGPGTTWALMAPNLPEYAVVFHALAWCGATVTTVNPTYGAEEVAFQLKDAGASVIATVGMFLDVARAAAERAGVGEVVVIGAAVSPPVGPGDATPLASLFGAPLAVQVAVDPAEHVVVLPYSSGTTGLPKGVMLTHRNLVANLEQAGACMQLGEDDVLYAVLPFFHIYGMQILMNLAIAHGATVVTAPRFDLQQMLELIARHRITRLYLVPPIVLALAKHPMVDEHDLSSLKLIFSGAAPLGGEIADAAARRLGCSVGQGYGMTELSPVTHSTIEGDYRAGSVGKLLPSTECRLIDPGSGQDADPGEPGEVWIRGPQVMKGYLGNPDATAAMIDADGWLRTGDVATVDADGHTFIVDRLKELIKVKAFQVPPAELEALLITHPDVADAAVIGVPDEESGELPKAFVVRKPGAHIDAPALMAFVAEHVASYKRLHVVEFIDAIPKSASGKILRRELRRR